ncbi:MAG: hypothetical protein WA996_00605 [Candidatus Promineifilaceae bacterium]
MTTRTADISLRQAAAITAYAIPFMFLFLLLTAASQSLIVPGDAAATAKNIAENVLLLRRCAAMKIHKLVLPKSH